MQSDRKGQITLHSPSVPSKLWQLKSSFTCMMCRIGYMPTIEFSSRLPFYLAPSACWRLRTSAAHGPCDIT